MSEQWTLRGRRLRLLLSRALFVVGCAAGVTFAHWLASSAPAHAAIPTIPLVNELAGQGLLSTAPHMVEPCSATPVIDKSVEVSPAVATAIPRIIDSTQHLADHVAVADKRIRPLASLGIIHQVSTYLIRPDDVDDHSDRQGQALAVPREETAKSIPASPKPRVVSRNLSGTPGGQDKVADFRAFGSLHQTVLANPRTELPMEPAATNSVSHAGSAAPTAQYYGVGTLVVPPCQASGAMAATSPYVPVAPGNKPECTPD